MQFLTRELAQEIVERTMSILNRNINVMNESGVIIGSGIRSESVSFTMARCWCSGQESVSRSTS